MEKLDIRSLKANAEPGKLYRVGGYGTCEFVEREEDMPFFEKPEEDMPFFVKPEKPEENTLSDDKEDSRRRERSRRCIENALHGNLLKL